MPDSDKTKILIVDDLPEKHLVYQVILEELGQEIVAARSGEEALKQVLAHDFAVILLDVNMPGMDGFETAALIRQRKRSAHTPIIFITAFADELRAAEGYAMGAVDYILAPVVPGVLRAKVKVFVDLFRMTEQVKRQAQEQIALVEERSRRAAAEEANRRLGFLARAGAVLGKSLDIQVTVGDALRLTVPALADRATIVQRDAASEQWSMQAFHESSDPVREQATTLVQLPADLAGAIQRVLWSGDLETLPESQPDSPTTIVVPLHVRGRTFAVLVLSREPSGRVFAPADRTMAEALASRTASALDNAQLYKNLELADRQRNEFLSMLAHELRNPLGPIRNAVAVLRRSGSLGQDVQRAHEMIDRQVTQLARLVDDLLDVSRITSGKIQLKLEYVDVAAIVAAAVETCQPHVDAQGHHFVCELPDVPLYVHADPTRMSQVLANLLHNAAKFTPPGGTIHLTAIREGEQAVFRVRDTGIGIPPDMLASIFDLFTQVERSIDRSQGGLGIGLTLVERMVQLHGGLVEAKSAGEGRGSEFVVRLPAVDAAALPEAPDEEPAESAADADNLRILVVDDNVDSADSLAWLLRLSGHQTRIAYDGPSALEAAQSFHPQAVVLDLGLPGLDGFAVASRLREDPSTAGALLVAVSGYGQSEDLRRSREAGFDHHFVKPVNIDALLQTLSGDRSATGAAAPANQGGE